MKSYWIVQVDVNDPEAYKAYMTANAAPIGKFGGRFLVRGMDHKAVEGGARSRLVMVEFPSAQAAGECYNSPEYSSAKSIRDGLSVTDFVIAPGYDGPQPAGAR
ncbi:DUF1330 domain-containing protein [Devosia sp. XGJD_8]|uniref:DUF1330 domain-containing protein n=1 Tax=Devosia sp. XGJD_8 TaxID=3391187 RepID=UPI003984A14F